MMKFYKIFSSFYEKEDSGEPTAHCQTEERGDVVRRSAIDWICSPLSLNNFQTIYRQHNVQQDTVTQRHTGRFLTKIILL